MTHDMPIGACADYDFDKSHRAQHFVYHAMLPILAMPQRLPRWRSDTLPPHFSPAKKGDKCAHTVRYCFFDIAYDITFL